MTQRLATSWFCARSFFDRLVLCSFVLLAIAAVAQDAKPNTPDPSSVRPISILFSATDSSGNPVRDLAKDEVVVFEGNGADRVDDLRPVSRAPLSVGIVLMSSKDKFAKEQAAAVALIQKLIRSENDQAFVVTAGGTKAWGEGELRWESNRDTLIKIINSLDKNAGIPDAFNYSLSSSSGETPTSVRRWSIEGQQEAAASVFDVAWAMMMADGRPARRVLVMFRTPWAHAPGPTKSNGDYVDQEHVEIIKEAQRLHVSIFTIGFDEGSPATTNPDLTALQSNYAMNVFGDMSRAYDRQYQLLKERLYNGGRSNIERLANETGGRAWWITKSNYIDGVNAIANHLDGQYLLTFVPHGSTSGSHELRLNCERAHIAAPGAYVLVDMRAK